MKKPNEHFLKILNFWDQFWFHADDRLGSEMCRILLGITTLYIVLIRSFNLDFFTEKSFLPREDSLLMMSENTRPLFSWNLWPDSWTVFMHILLLILLGFFTVGRGGRAVVILCFILLMGFIQRNFAVLFGADVVGALLFFYFIFNPAQDTLVLFAGKLNRPNKLKKDWDQALCSVGFRFIQVQMVLMYAYTGFEKLRGASWWNGSALWTVLANPQMAVYDFTFLRHMPFVVGIMNYSGIIFEVYFIAAMFTQRLRLFWLTFGILFHFLIGWWLDLMPFSLIMVSTYFCFLSRSEIVKMLEYLKSRFFILF